jgi:hypothetical protein
MASVESLTSPVRLAVFTWQMALPAHNSDAHRARFKFWFILLVAVLLI